jgi:ribosomal protein L7/L12
MADLSKLVNQLSNLTVLEAAKLAKTLQARWDVQPKPNRRRCG